MSVPRTGRLYPPGDNPPNAMRPQKNESGIDLQGHFSNVIAKNVNVHSYILKIKLGYMSCAWYRDGESLDIWSCN